MTVRFLSTFEPILTGPLYFGLGLYYASNRTYEILKRQAISHLSTSQMTLPRKLIAFASILKGEGVNNIVSIALLIK